MPEKKVVDGEGSAGGVGETYIASLQLERFVLY